MLELIKQTIIRGVAQPGSAPPWGGGGRRFKSSRPDQYSSRSKTDFRFGVHSTRLMYDRHQVRWVFAHWPYILTSTNILKYMESRVVLPLLPDKILTFTEIDGAMNLFCIFGTYMISVQGGGL